MKQPTHIHIAYALATALIVGGLFAVISTIQGNRDTQASAIQELVAAAKQHARNSIIRDCQNYNYFVVNDLTFACEQYYVVPEKQSRAE